MATERTLQFEIILAMNKFSHRGITRILRFGVYNLFFMSETYTPNPVPRGKIEKAHEFNLSLPYILKGIGGNLPGK